MRGLLCKASLHVCTILVFSESVLSPVMEQEHEDLLCPGSAHDFSKVKTGKGGPEMMSSGETQFLGSLCAEQEPATQKASQDVSPCVS